ncbi:DUF3299 domain-containing protein [Altericroceibacterium endophyticum]|uniref:DUF3299 domain-containing protein n=1 Tax=Altericroceibacterium endophyticum TaxID=1808508 RepID=A0A6I4T7H4_9SPHN|nr:DUF3299 domain-containing protein [Altericroceibacterium endophyticum]MXO66202.1 DUF3299 domain-containing protein [Altericroceibacterium endophyticum]
MNLRAFLAATAAVVLLSTPANAIREQKMPAQQQSDIWKPAATPKGGISWATLEATKEIARKDAEGYIISKPVFTPNVKKLEGKRIKVAGWMDAFKPGRTQDHFLLMAYPPGCPFHFHAAPNQYIEIKASKAFPLAGNDPIVVTGVLELTGYDESGIFYVLKDARPA